jgi:hypothetical protein
MDAGYILVAVLTSAAVAWLVWVEIHSRRNAALQTARELPEAPESQTNGAPAIIGDTRARRQDKGKVRAT